MTKTDGRFFQKAQSTSKAATISGALIPLATSLEQISGAYGIQFDLRHLISATPKHLRPAGPKPNPFHPWDPRLEVETLGNEHVLILNKYPVQFGHMLLITREWKPQTGWLQFSDFGAVASVDADTTGLWFFNSGPDAGASQPHRHLQLLPRATDEQICPRDRWFRAMADGTHNDPKDRIQQFSRVYALKGPLDGSILHGLYLRLAGELGLGHPQSDPRPRRAYNLLLCRNWMALILRGAEGTHGFSVNALGFAGSLLCTPSSDRNWIVEEGPDALLASVLPASV